MTDRNGASIEQERYCPHCGSDNIDSSIETAPGICIDCGSVIQEFNTIPNSNQNIGDHDGVQNRLQRDWKDHVTVTTSTEQQVAEALEKMDEGACELGLTNNVRARAASIYADAAKSKATAGRSMDIVVGACLFVSARENGKPRPAEHVGAAVGRCGPDVLRLTRVLYRELNLEYVDCEPEAYVPYLGDQLGCSQGVQLKAKHLLQRATTAGLTTGRNPAGCVAAAFYMMTEGISQREIAIVAGVTRETIRLIQIDLRNLEDTE